MSGKLTIIGLGEILWDIFEDVPGRNEADGRSARVLGGAPCNFAYHVNGLGHTGVPLSRAGEDRLGDDIIRAVQDLGMDPRYIQRDPERPTGAVLVGLDQSGTPDFTIVQDVAWDYMEPDDRWLALAARSDAVCFGTLAQRCAASRRTIQQVLDSASSALTICDINFRQRFYSREVVTESLAAADVLKLNGEELDMLAQVLAPARPRPADAFIRGLMADYELRMVCVTLGADGCRLVTPEETVARPVPPTDVMDTVGSGDAFTAALAVKFLDGAGLGAVAEAANLMGAFVAAHRGATPILTDEVLERFRAL